MSDETEKHESRMKEIYSIVADSHRTVSRVYKDQQVNHIWGNKIKSQTFV